MYVLIFKGHERGRLCWCEMKSKWETGSEERKRVCGGEAGGKAAETVTVVKNVKEVDVEMNSSSIM